MLRTEGLVINSIKYMESSKILTVFTRNYGKLSVMAKGVSKPRSSNLASVQLFALSDFIFHKGKNFFYITYSDIKTPLYELRNNIDRMMAASYMVEMVDKSIDISQRNSKIYGLLIKSLKQLEHMDKEFLKLITAFQVKFVSFLGFRPELTKCVNCDKKEGSSFYFSKFEGGLLCNNCFKLDLFSRSMTIQDIKTINFLLFLKLEEIKELKIDSDRLKYIHKILEEYILHNIDRSSFNSLRNAREFNNMS